MVTVIAEDQRAFGQTIRLGKYETQHLYRATEADGSS